MSATTKTASTTSAPAPPLVVDLSKVPKTAKMVPPAEFSYPPEESFLQVAAVTIWISIMPMFVIGIPVALSLFSFFYPYHILPLLLVYFMVVYTLDRDAENRGGWGIVGVGKWFYALPFWNHYREFFHARLIKTAELPADRNYIFSAHPHGVYALGFFANITGNPKVFKQTFPGIKLMASTLPVNFRIPLWREFLLSLGMVSCDRKALQRVLLPKKADKGTGKVMIIMTGGAEEYLTMEPKTLDLVVNKRKGFVKLALTTGASIVPILSFGENDLYTRIETPLVKKLNAFTKKVAHFAFPAFSGRFGVMPHRVPLTTVVGAPIFVDKAVPHPTDEQIDQLHAEYCKQLRKLYDDYKDIFHTDRVREMQYVK
ncbi:diacylglycerol O-acyltransferase 1 [Phlyctochytrium bullatum]|nr:diacylglycerol O-acyltransferase 1 [Phlyctochytrium bullatum]